MPPDALFCPECGSRIDGGMDEVAVSEGRSSPVVASILCLIVPGLGLLYLKNWMRGFAWIAGSLIASYIVIYFIPGLLSVIWLFPVLSAVDAWREAKIR